MIRQNLHTHTTFCDGKSTAEELVKTAISLGCSSLGFSGHAPLPPPEGQSWTMSPDRVETYRQELLRLREQYRDQLDIFPGLEQDIDSPAPGDGWDYLIGSVHDLYCGGQCYSVDNTREMLLEAVDLWFGGDPLALAEAYYARVAQVADITGCQIVGHFDLVTKFNEGCSVFQDTHPRYQRAALDALDALCGKNLIFEINTGAMARGYRSAPYPAPFLLQELARRGEAVCITSDCHQAENLLFAFDLAEELARSCGFTETMILTKEGFVPQKL